jgi:hypothetical protein
MIHSVRSNKIIEITGESWNRYVEFKKEIIDKTTTESKLTSVSSPKPEEYDKIICNNFLKIAYKAIYKAIQYQNTDVNTFEKSKLKTASQEFVYNISKMENIKLNQNKEVSFDFCDNPQANNIGYYEIYLISVLKDIYEENNNKSLSLFNHTFNKEDEFVCKKDAFKKTNKDSAQLYIILNEINNSNVKYKNERYKLSILYYKNNWVHTIIDFSGYEKISSNTITENIDPNKICASLKEEGKLIRIKIEINKKATKTKKFRRN